MLACRGPGAAGGLVAHAAAAAAVLRQLLLTSPLSSPPPQLTRSVRHVSYVLLCLETGKLVFVHKTIDKKKIAAVEGLCDNSANIRRRL